MGPAPSDSQAVPQPLLGAHFSIAKGLHNALLQGRQYDCTAIQLFTKNASTWKERVLRDTEIDPFLQAITETDIRHIASHTAYLINLASPDERQHERSLQALQNEYHRCTQLKIPYMVLHPGSHRGTGVDAGVRQVADGLNRLFDAAPGGDAHLLLETTAGQGQSVGHRFEHIAAMMDLVEDKQRIGVCLDTSHIFAAGYDLRTRDTYHETIAVFDQVIGLSNLMLLHLNDSKKEFASHVDRHEHIGRGAIGLEAFACIMNDLRLNNIPKIIETPKGNGEIDYDRINLDRLRDMVIAPSKGV